MVAITDRGLTKETVLFHARMSRGGLKLDLIKGEYHYLRNQDMNHLSSLDKIKAIFIS